MYIIFICSKYSGPVWTVIFSSRLVKMYDKKVSYVEKTKAIEIETIEVE